MTEQSFDGLCATPIHRLTEHVGEQVRCPHCSRTVDVLGSVSSMVSGSSQSVPPRLPKQESIAETSVVSEDAILEEASHLNTYPRADET